MCSCWQYGGGLYIVGTATLTDTNVYENLAYNVCSPVEPSWALTQRPTGTFTCVFTCAHGWQDGGGLAIAGTATLTDTNVYENQARWVCSPVEPCLSTRTVHVLMAGREAGDSSSFITARQR